VAIRIDAGKTRQTIRFDDVGRHWAGYKLAKDGGPRFTAHLNWMHWYESGFTPTRKGSHDDSEIA